MYPMKNLTSSKKYGDSLSQTNLLIKKWDCKIIKKDKMEKITFGLAMGNVCIANLVSRIVRTVFQRPLIRNFRNFLFALTVLVITKIFHSILCQNQG
jgi:hypothetical protein